MKLVLMSSDMNLGWVMMSLNTGMLWLTPVVVVEEEEEEEEESDCKGGRWCDHEGEERSLGRP